jgi:hypothetical protein
MLPQQQLELCSRVYLLMVLFLACNVLPHGRHLGSADAAREISYLPAKSYPRMVVHPSRGICLQHLHGLCNAESRSHINEGVYVVLNAIDRDCVHVMFFCDARHVRLQFRLQVFRDHLQAVLRAEYDVDVVADVRTGHCVVPSGLLSFNATRHSRAGLQVVPSLRDSRVANWTRVKSGDMISIPRV